MPQTKETKETTARSTGSEMLFGGAFLIAGLALLAAALFVARVPPPLARLFFYLSALLLVVAAGFLSAFLTARARRRGRLARRGAIRRTGKSLPRVVEKAREQTDRLWVMLANIDWLGDWLAVVATAAISLAALYGLMKGWRSTAPAPSAFTNEMTVGVLLVLSFPLLVLERKYAGMPERILPEAPLVARLSRVPLLGLLGLALGAGLRWLDLPFATPVEHAVAIVTGIVAAELFLRSIVFIFVPLPPLDTRRSHADSVVAGLIRAQIPNFRAFSASMRRNFGIDLARSWALGFIRRATVPLLLGMAVFSWLLTGVTALGLNERAVYQAFGEPQGVLHPGIHVHWPWPFGVLRPVEYGAVREIPVYIAADGRAPSGTMPILATSDIESEPGPEEDRLWDSSHEEEGSYLTAAFSNGRQSFEVVDIDINVVYRIGLSDEAAMQAIYHVASPEASVQAIAGQILARYFAHYTIDDILGQNREAFVQHFQKELQTRLTALSSGIEVMAVVVGGIHPPPKAASSYQGVQAATIESVIKVSTADAESKREMKMAGVVSQSTRNDALSAAAERVSKAKMDFTLFDGDRKAYAAGGPSFLFERRLDRLDKGLVDKPVIILDHRIPAATTPTLDMRQSGGARGGNFGDPTAD